MVDVGEPPHGTGGIVDLELGALVHPLLGYSHVPRPTGRIHPLGRQQGDASLAGDTLVTATTELRPARLIHRLQQIADLVLVVAAKPPVPRLNLHRPVDGIPVSVADRMHLVDAPVARHARVDILSCADLHLRHAPQRAIRVSPHADLRVVELPERALVRAVEPGGHLQILQVLSRRRRRRLHRCEDRVPELGVSLEGPADLPELHVLGYRGAADDLTEGVVDIGVGDAAVLEQHVLVGLEGRRLVQELLVHPECGR